MLEITIKILVSVATALATAVLGFITGKISSVSKEKLALQKERFKCFYSPFKKRIEFQFLYSGAFSFSDLSLADQEEITNFFVENYDYASPELKSWLSYFFHIASAYRKEQDPQTRDEINQSFITIIQISSFEYDKLCRKLYYSKAWTMDKFIRHHSELPKK